VDVSAYILWHTAATRWLRVDVDVVVVAGLLGHASLDATRTYSQAANFSAVADVADVGGDGSATGGSAADRLTHGPRRRPRRRRRVR